MNRFHRIPFTLALTALLALGAGSLRAQQILNVSYDPTRELYQEVNPRSLPGGRPGPARP